MTATERPYEVHLEIFEGPLDLLLYLIKKDDLEITDIPLSQITGEYLAYVDLMRELNLEVAGEFLVMAATLVQIKARSLLPTLPDEGEEGPDPGAELMQKLAEYQKFKGAARFLAGQAEAYKDVHYRGAPKFRAEEKTLGVSLFELMAALKEILDRIPDSRGIEVEAFPIEEKMQKILFLLERQPRLPLAEVFADERRRMGVIACFLALLELIKLQKAMARQEEAFGSIYVFRRTDQGIEAAPRPAAETPEAAQAPAEPGIDETGGTR